MRTVRFLPNDRRCRCRPVLSLLVAARQAGLVIGPLRRRRHLRQMQGHLPGGPRVLPVPRGGTGSPPPRGRRLILACEAQVAADLDVESRRRRQPHPAPSPATAGRRR
jgi:hypothetical protein